MYVCTYVYVYVHVHVYVYVYVYVYVMYMYIYMYLYLSLLSFSLSPCLYIIYIPAMKYHLERREEFRYKVCSPKGET